MADDQPTSFVYAYGSGLALHRDGGRLTLVVAKQDRIPLSPDMAERIGQDLFNAARAARKLHQGEGCAPTPGGSGLGGETSGDG